jgi:hypothetical protein
MDRIVAAILIASAAAGSLVLVYCSDGNNGNTPATPAEVHDQPGQNSQ